jgi:hypothetical protein
MTVLDYAPSSQFKTSRNDCQLQIRAHGEPLIAKAAALFPYGPSPAQVPGGRVERTSVRYLVIKLGSEWRNLRAMLVHVGLGKSTSRIQTVTASVTPQR